MAGVQDSALTIAVSNAGGLGSLPCAMLRPDALREELKFIKSQTSKPFNLNFFFILLQNQILSAKQDGGKFCSPISRNML